MNRICTYIINTDKGFAPNPFWGYCTLSVCTPNHMGANLDNGDWIAGFLGKNRGHKFVYAMEISEKLNLTEYFQDSRFQLKKPNLDGDWKERCGDNFYSQNEDGFWTQHRNRFHIGEAAKLQDIRNPTMFLAERFWYLGKSAMTPPEKFQLMFGGIEIRVNHPEELFDKFKHWVVTNFKEGITDVPNDNAEINKYPRKGDPEIGEIGC